MLVLIHIQYYVRQKKHVPSQSFGTEGIKQFDTSHSLAYGLVSNGFCNIMLQEKESFILSSVRFGLWTTIFSFFFSKNGTH